MMVALKVRRSTIAAQSRGSVRVLLQPVNASLEAIALLLRLRRSRGLPRPAAGCGHSGRPHRGDRLLAPHGQGPVRRHAAGSGPIGTHVDTHADAGAALSVGIAHSVGDPAHRAGCDQRSCWSHPARCGRPTSTRRRPSRWPGHVALTGSADQSATHWTPFLDAPSSTARVVQAAFGNRSVLGRGHRSRVCSRATTARSTRSTAPTAGFRKGDVRTACARQQQPRDRSHEAPRGR